MVVAAAARRLGITLRQRVGQARAGVGDDDGRVVLAIPQTFMNESGEAVAALRARWPGPLTRLLVVCDDVALPFGVLRLRPQGSDGGHRGLRSVIDAVQSEAFPRLRVGIQAAVAPEALDAFVLAPFAAAERRELSDVIDRAAEACGVWMQHGIEAAMNQYNRKACRA